MKMMITPIKPLLTVAILFATVANGQDSLPSAHSSQDVLWTIPSYVIKVVKDGKGPLETNVHCALIVTTEPLSETSSEVLALTFQARMPEHKHGMVTVPVVTKLSRNKFRIEGVRFHMPGKWLLEFGIKDKNGETFASSLVTLEP